MIGKERYTIEDLRSILMQLRGENGCPWDREQTHESIRKDFLEEVYEAVEAIDLGDPVLLREELGDVLLQVAFHAQIEEEQSRFTFDDVCDEVCRKLIIRHPHVFGDVQVENTEEVLKNWDAIKKETKGQETYTDTLHAVAKSLPALMRAQKLGKRAARAGMDFRTGADAFSCIRAETEELAEAMQNGSQKQIEEEFGDLLFSCVNTARHLGIDAEEALTAASEKFIRRFARTEALLRAEELDMAQLPIEELDRYWAQAKQTEKDESSCDSINI